MIIYWLMGRMTVSLEKLALRSDFRVVWQLCDTSRAVDSHARLSHPRGVLVAEETENKIARSKCAPPWGAMIDSTLLRVTMCLTDVLIPCTTRCNEKHQRELEIWYALRFCFFKKILETVQLESVQLESVQKIMSFIVSLRYCFFSLRDSPLFLSCFYIQDLFENLV